MASSSDTCTNPTYPIFISHAGPDKESMAIPLREKLKELGINAFVDKMDMQVGEGAPEAMTLAMETARVAVIILSPEYTARRWTIKELQCFQRRVREAEAKGLVKPVIITLFYRLPIKDCYGRFLWQTGDDGKIPFLDQNTRFLERRDAGEPEADLSKLCETIKLLPKTVGIENDQNASNDPSEEMKQKRGRLLDKVCQEVMSTFKRELDQPAAQLSGSAVQTEDSYKPKFEAPANQCYISIDMRTRDENGEYLTVEGKVKAHVVEHCKGSPNIVGIHGAGGVGKTITVKQIGTDDDIRQRFPGGVLFIQLGQDATEQKAIDEIIRVVKCTGGTKLAKELSKLSNVDEVIEHAAKWLEGQSNLVILDDVWEKGDIGEGFVHKVSEIVRGGRDSTLLFTTREPITAGQAGDKSIHFEPKDPTGEEALSILLRSAGRPFEDWKDEAVREVILKLLELCGGLPVALDVTGKGVRAIAARMNGNHKVAWKIYAQNLEQCIKKLLRERGHSEYPPVLANVQATLGVLSKRDGGDGLWEERFSRLCVLAKQGWGAEGMVCKLWGMESVETAIRGMQMLVDCGLGEMESREIEGKAVQGIRMHDLLNEAANEIAKEMGGMEGKHCGLLGAYRVVSGEGEHFQWDSEKVEADFYIHQNLAWHLVMAGRRKELVELLLQPGWVKRQTTVSGTEKLKEDLDRGLGVLEGWRDEGCDEVDELNIAVKGKSRDEKVEKVKRALEAIKEAVRFGSYAMTSNPSEVYFQMQGRLVEIGKDDEVVRQYLDRILACAERPWLRSINRCLDSAGGALKSLKYLGSEINCAAEIGKTKRVLCGCRDGKLRVVNLWKEEIELEWDAHESAVTAVDVSKDGNKMVSGSHYDGTLKIWGRNGVQHFNTFSVYRVHANYFFERVAFTEDERRILLSGREGNIMQRLGGWLGFPPNRIIQKIMLVSFRVGAVMAKSIIILLDIESGSILQKLKVRVDCAALLGDGTALFAIRENAFKLRNTFQKWRLDGERTIGLGAIGYMRREAEGQSSLNWVQRKVCKWCCWRKGETEFRKVSALAVYDKIVLAGYDDGTIRMLDVDTLETLQDMSVRASYSIKCLAMSEDKRLIISGSGDGIIQTWDIERRREFCAPLYVNNYYGITFLSFMKGSEIVACSDDGFMRRWNLLQTNSVEQVPVGVNFVRFLPCGTRVISGSTTFGGSANSSALRMWDATTGKQIREKVICSPWEFSCIAIFPDGSKIVTVQDRILRVVDTASLQEIQTLQGHTGSVECVTVTPDGKRVLSGSLDRTIRVWDAESGKAVHILRGHKGSVFSVTVTPDGKRVISVSYDGTVCVWDLESHQSSHRLKEGCHLIWESQVSFSKDGQRAVLGLSDEIVVFNLQTYEVVRTIVYADSCDLPLHQMMREAGEGEDSPSTNVWIKDRKYITVSSNDSTDMVLGTLDFSSYLNAVSDDGSRLCVVRPDEQLGFMTIEGLERAGD